MKWTGAVSTICLLSLAAAGCAGTAGKAGSGPKGDYKFAVIGPFSGDTAVYGENLKMGAELAAGQLNASGGINGHKVKLEYIDTQCQATQAASVAAKVASDRSVFAVIGDVCSSATLAAIPILNRAGLTIMSPDSTSPKITEVVRSKHYTNFARNIPTDAQMARGMVNLATKIMHKRNLGILYASDDFGQPVLEHQKKVVPQVGAKIVDSETYAPAKTKDFTPQLSKLAAAHPDAILVDGYYSDGGPAVAQMARAGLGKTTVIGSAGMDLPDYIKLAGNAAEGTYIFSYYNVGAPSPANQKFLQAFRAKYGAGHSDSVMTYVVFGYEIPFIFQKAIQAGATRATLAQKVRTVSYDGPTGLSKFDENGDVVGKSGVVLQVKDGKFVFQPDLTTSVNR